MTALLGESVVQYWERIGGIFTLDWKDRAMEQLKQSGAKVRNNIVVDVLKEESA